MESFWLTAYLILAGLAIVQSVLLSLQTWEHRRYGRSCMRDLGRHRPRGRVAVFAPCKGVDVEAEGNLRALLRQDYDDYEVTFVVESADDPAAEVINRLIAEHPQVATRLVVAGRSTTSGQKVHNLRVATADLSPAIKYLVFVDSDARPRPEWLRVLISRLCDPGTAAATGYRWFVPDRASIANHLVYSMNCDVMSLLGRSSHYLVWGGSWGIRRDAFHAIGLHEAWEGTLSDDLIASRQLRRNKLGVRFEGPCVVASPLEISMRQMVEFLRRQYLIGRFYARNWWTLSVLASTLPVLTWWGSLAMLGCGLIFNSPPAWIPGSLVAVLYLLSVQRGFVRQDLLRTYFPERQQALRKAARFDIWANPVVGLVGWLGILGSFWGRHITWRGIRYRLGRGGQICEIRRKELRFANEADPAQPDLASQKTVPYRKAG